MSDTFAVPAGWQVVRLGSIGTLEKGRGGSKEDNREFGVPVVRYGDLYTKFRLTIDQPASYVSPEDAPKYSQLPTGSLVFAASGESAEDIGAVALSRLREPAVVGGDSVLMHPIPTADPMFLAYALNSAPSRAQKALRSTGFTVVHISAGRLKTIRLPVPPLKEQRAIADYLDRETAQIDELIGKQERLIETLRERRAAVVSRAFDGMSDETVQLRRAVSFLTSGSRGWGDFYADQGERFLRIGNLPRTDIRLRGDVQYVDLPPGVSEGERTRLRSGDLLFSITAYLGSVAVVSDEWVGAYVSQHVALCRLRDAADPAFVGWFMLSRDGQDQLKQGAAGGTKQQLSLLDIRELRVPLPPLDEQRRIATYLDEQTAKIDTLIAKAERFIELSKERRAALITAAVTGQIDVREAV